VVRSCSGGSYFGVEKKVADWVESWLFFLNLALRFFLFMRIETPLTTDQHYAKKESHPFED
jgi:hypothetical protein